MEGWENILFNPISASHLAKIIEFMIDNDVVGLFNIGCTNACNKYDFASAVCSNLNLDAEIVKSKLVNDLLRPYNTITDCTKFFGYADLGLTWQEDLARYMKDMPMYPVALDQ